MGRRYQVIFQDEYNNLSHLGFFNELKDSLEKVNNVLESYQDQMLDDDGKKCEFTPLTEHDLVKYASTFGECFDKEIWTECGSIYIRGFIFYDLEEELKSL